MDRTIQKITKVRVSIGDCEMYKKHHNIINGIYTMRLPETWEDIPVIDQIDAEDEEKELFNLFQDVTIYDIEDLAGFVLPTDEHHIEETIFVIRRDGEYFLCETQGENFVKFATKISDVDFVELYDRSHKVNKLHEKSTYSRTEPDQQDIS